MTATAQRTPSAPTEQLKVTGRPHDRTPAELAFKYALLACLIAGVLFLVVLLTYVAYEGLPRLDANLFTQQASRRNPETSGAQAAIIGTVWVALLTAAMVVPTGIMAAIYLEEYADTKRWYNRYIEIIIQNLAAVPSVVYGILGLGLIVRGPLDFGPVVLAGALVLTLLVLPVVIIAAREALRSVPDTLRHGSLALGATQLQTVTRVVLPNAVPGMATGSILALSRAIGEAAPLVIIGAVTFVQFNPASVWDRFTTLPLQIYNLVSQPQQEFRELAYALIIVLLAILLLMNSVAIFIRSRFQRRW